MNQKIVFTARGVAELLDAPMPTVGDKDVLVKIVRTSISAGTERANLLGDVYSMRTGKPLGFPRQCGYSASGIVEEIGKDVTSVKVGDRVACAWSDHAAYCALPEHRVYRIDDTVDFGAAALIHIATFPIAAVRKVQLEIGESAIVMGQGVLGMMAVGLLRAAKTKGRCFEIADGGQIFRRYGLIALIGLFVGTVGGLFATVVVSMVSSPMGGVIFFLHS